MNARLLRVLTLALLCAAAAPITSVSAEGDAAGDDAVVLALPRAKHSLLEAVRAAAKSPSVAISAKFEDEGKGLSLSVYAARSGLDVEPGANVLQELAGDPAAAEWKPATEVFQDVVHVARASEQLTLMRTTKLNLAEVIEKTDHVYGLLHGAGVYSIAPAVRAGKRVFLVRVVAQGKWYPLTLDLQTGVAIAPMPRIPLRPEPTPLVGRQLPAPVVGPGRWIGTAPRSLTEVAATKVLLVASNSYLCEQTDEAYAWPKLAAWLEELGPKGLEVWSVVWDAESLDQVETYVRSKKLSYPVLYDPKGVNAEAWKAGGVAMAFLLDREGRVLWQGRIGPQGDAEGCEAALRQELSRRAAAGTLASR